MMLVFDRVHSILPELPVNMLYCIIQVYSISIIFYMYVCENNYKFINIVIELVEN